MNLTASSPWALYDRLIADVPEDVLVRDLCLGTHWSYVEADCGMGVAFTTTRGAQRTDKSDWRGRPLRELAELAKSWCFEEATLGVAALNAWYSRPELVVPLGAQVEEPVELPDGSIRRTDAFEMVRPQVEAAGPQSSVVVIGHFPHVDRVQEYAQLTVLERACTGPLDTPDPACEYVLPEADFVFMTGVTLINKTAPRLLTLASGAGAFTTMVGPSAVMAPVLLESGVDFLAGSMVADPEKAAFAVKTGAGQFFGEALQMVALRR